MDDLKYKLISKKYKEFFWPTLAMTMANNMALFVDSVLVSTFLGVARMPAVQLCFPVVAFVNMMYWMIGIGGSLLVSNELSDHNKKKARYIYSVSMTTVVLIGAIVMALGLVFTDGLVSLLCNEPTLVVDVRDYLKPLLIGMPFLCLIMSASYFARIDGAPKAGFRSVLISNSVNLCMDCVLLKVFHIGTEGASLATLTGYIFGTMYMFTYLLSKKKELRFVNPFRGLQFFITVKDITLKGIPTASSQLYITLRTQILNTIVQKYGGPVGLQVFSIYKNSLFLAYIIFIGTAQTLSPIVSVYTHEGEYDKARYVLKRSIRIVLIGGVILGAVFAIFPQIILFLYRVDSPEVVSACTMAIRLFVFSYPGLAFYYIMSYYFQAVKKQVAAMVFTALEGLVFPVAFIAALAPAFHMKGVWAGVIAVETVTALLIPVYMLIVKRRSENPSETVFLLPAKINPNRYSFSVNMNIHQSVKLSEDVFAWVKKRSNDEKAANKTCLALEEMLTGIVMANGEKDDVIDVVLREEDDGIIISLRDMGVVFNPVVEDKDLSLEFDNVSVLNKVAAEVKYTRSIGMNSTMIKIR